MLSQEVYDITDGNGRSAVIVFSWVDGKKIYAEARMPKGAFDMFGGSYEDWMFLGAVAGEIRRIQEGGGDHERAV